MVSDSAFGGPRMFPSLSPTTVLHRAAFLRLRWIISVFLHDPRLNDIIFHVNSNFICSNSVPTPTETGDSFSKNISLDSMF